MEERAGLSGLSGEEIMVECNVREQSPENQPVQIPTQSIDFARIQRWRTECESHHGACCNDRYSESLAQHISNLILIDVNLGCLVTLPSLTRFITLSYVWGRTPMPKTRKANLSALKEPGVLFHGVEGIAIPRTIREAMYLVKGLGEKYLWVDCLCLVQDAETEQMHGMLRAMAYIYASAEFTIVAAGGSNADHGLPGVDELARTRPSVAVEERMVRDGFPWWSTWASRGWTFQESLFARRLLIFDDFVSWVCGRCIWLEDARDSFERPVEWPLNRPHLGVPMGLLSLIPPHPSLGRWGMLVEHFSSRALTYEEDVESAFAGATNIMDSTFPGGLLHGLPAFFFDIALLWQPVSSVSQRPGQPSWSWIGWKGPVDCLRPWSQFYPGVYRPDVKSSHWVATANLKPLASYQIWNMSSDTEIVSPSHLNSFYEHQALREDSDASIPEGWTRRSHPDGDYYTHRSYEGEDLRFSYPLPLVTYPLQGLAIAASPVLVCTAPIAKLSFGIVEVQISNGPVVAELLLEKLSVGDIIVHDQSSDFLDGFSSLRYDLVAISEAEVQDFSRPSEDFYITPLSGKIMQNQKISFYNVLLIDWNHDIAHRKGIGVVNKEAWDSLGAQTVTFKLG